MTSKFSTALLLAVCFAGPALAQSDSASSRPTVLIHGNYCGPGNNAPLPPIDALDAACARHDACTPDGGLPTKACNLRLQRDAALVARDPHEPDDLRALAGIVSAGASMMLSQSQPAAPAATALAPGHAGWSHAALSGPAEPDSDAE